MITNFNNLNSSFPKTIGTIKKYMGLDRDFEQLCVDFDELSETIEHLQNSDLKTYNKMKTRISNYKQLKAEMMIEINRFLLEERKNDGQ